MATAEQVADFRAAIDDLSTLAIRDVNELLGYIGEQPPREVRNALIELLPETLTPYITASGELSAVWYEDLRSAAVGGRFYASADTAIDLRRVDKLARFGVKPLFGQSNSSVLSLLGGGVQKMVAGASRDTIESNASRDVVTTGWARVPQAGCCAFCGMLASRGAVYRSEASAGNVVGRGVDSSIALDADGNRRKGYVGGVGGGVKARGKQSLGDDYHVYCRCVLTPVFSEGDNSAVQESTSKYTQMYRQTGGLVPASDGRGLVTDYKSTLASWREVHGTK